MQVRFNNRARRVIMQRKTLFNRLGRHRAFFYSLEKSKQSLSRLPLFNFFKDIEN